MQRVPTTEKRGRRHSSEIVVSAIPDGQANEARIDPADVRIDTYRDSGPGGQHRNTTDSAVRLTHKPTGIVVTAAEERSQYLNRQAAWARLKAALAEADQTARAEAANRVRAATFTEPRQFTWTGWRDQVKFPGGTATMSRALAGRLDPLL